MFMKKRKKNILTSYFDGDRNTIAIRSKRERLTKNNMKNMA